MTLLIMLKDLGLRAIDVRLFDITEPLFQDTYETTWTELEEAYFVKPNHVIGARLYRLTGHGWYRAMDATWDQNQDVLNDLLGKLMAALKERVAGRHEPGYIYLDQVANAGLPEGFVYDAIESNLIEYRLNKHGAHWYEGRVGGLIEVPIKFGHEML